MTTLRPEQPAPDYVPGHDLLAGKVVVVTAAAGAGIGAAVVRRALEEGAKAVDLKAKKLVEEEPAAEKAEKAPAAKKPKAGKSLPAGKTAAKEGGGEKRGRKKGKKSVEIYKIYIFKVLKQVHPDTGISNKVLESDMCEK